MITKKEYLEAKMIIKLYESQQLNIPIVVQHIELLECDNGCDWCSVGHQLNGHQQCRKCGKQKAF